MTVFAKLRLITWLLLGIGLEMNIRGQMRGTTSGTPDPTSRMVWAVVPFVIFAIAVYTSAPTTLSAIIGAVSAALLWFLTTMYTNNEMRMSYILSPILQSIVVLLAIAALWLARRSQVSRSEGS